ncbi:hypothetical protein ACVIWV_009863 [Bradyrhizobium diazoefficiens]|jgi:hypothetical protein|uniref:hypothetical protein n=1 Tax=Bradyrhizobium diazoefficiens TaxID=1355477 RepID=UPI001013D4FE|nr:hypothetical protein [Bradyrhizobium diazoefficiens]MBR0868375.1 hypothetical protein [Bradyrhizobium diazoefficiens]MBR0893105.1 hypothetical protein [Bradyrhizobium diazoefficiens]MBR0924417.1 hypothetical protein [Bradyrhizobium diazoefficiens]
MRLVRAVIGLLLLAGGLYVIIGEHFAGTSADATVNARLYVVRAPIDGRVTLAVKSITTGHQAGDRAGPSDLPTSPRYDGDEFVLPLPNTDATGSAEASERIQQAIHDLAILLALNPAIQADRCDTLAHERQDALHVVDRGCRQGTLRRQGERPQSARHVRTTGSLAWLEALLKGNPGNSGLARANRKIVRSLVLIGSRRDPWADKDGNLSPAIAMETLS